MVMACPMADCGLSGATTTTSPNFFMTSTKAASPGALIPSSLVTSIMGLFKLFYFFYKAIKYLKTLGCFSFIRQLFCSGSGSLQIKKGAKDFSPPTFCENPNPLKRGYNQP